MDRTQWTTRFTGQSECARRACMRTSFRIEYVSERLPKSFACIGCAVQHAHHRPAPATWLFKGHRFVLGTGQRMYLPKTKTLSLSPNCKISIFPQETKLMKRAEMLYKTHSLASDLTITPSNGYRTPNGSHANHTSPSINTSSAMQPMNLSMVTVNAVTPTPVTSVTPQPPQSANAPNAGYKRPRQIFTLQQEDQLAAYVRDTATYYSGLSSKEVRIMAFVYGVCNQVEMPMGWRESHEASFDWCIGFVKRNKLAPMVFQGLSYKNNNIKSQPMQLPKLPSINANGSPHGKDEMRLANETNATTNGDGNGAAMSIEIDDWHSFDFHPVDFLSRVF